ncbi:MAG: hypothetical protein HQ517_08090, partial [SAR324 cluster bacterium]|nr:hypothetical protein [SAR324 cluster bacterium]
MKKTTSRMNKLMVLVILSFSGLSYSSQTDIKTIAAMMDAYEKQIDSIKLKYSYETPVKKRDGNRVLAKGAFAQKQSEGYILLDEISQRGKTWDDDKADSGDLVRSYNGQITRYLEHNKNKSGHYMAALYENHNPKLYLSARNPYHRVWGSN